MSKFGDFFWYHTMDLPECTTDGIFDWRPYFKNFGFKNIKGKTIIDVGAGNGYFSFEFEKMGADVTALDIPNQIDRDCYKICTNHIIDKKDTVDHKSPFYIAKDLLKSKVKHIDLDLYDISPKIGTYDIVFCNDVLLHLTDPIRALYAMHSVCKHNIIIGTPINNNILYKNKPIAYFKGGLDNNAYWIPNMLCLKHMMQCAGFKVVSSTYFKPEHKYVPLCDMLRGVVWGEI